jgi:alkylated DNA repair dioxygenase AlkB
VNNKCNSENCKFAHIDNICRNYFFGNCERENCKFNHGFKLGDQVKKLNNNISNNNNKIKHRNKIKNTESFEPDYCEPDMRIVFNQPINSGNQVAIIDNCTFWSDTITRLLNEISKDVYKPWHGDNHLIADDTLKWKEKSPTFKHIIDSLCRYFNMSISATRLNYYENGEDWKPYHHDAAALKPEKAKTQNITIGLSLGLTREISFQHAEKRTTINFPLEDGVIYAFGNKINIDFRHGIPQLKEKNLVNEPRLSIIIWGYSKYFN